MKRLLAVIFFVLSIILREGLDGGSDGLMAQNVFVGPPNLPSCVVAVPFEAPLPAPLSDSLFNACAGIAIYQVNRTELQSGDPFVCLLDSVVLPLANEREWILRGLEVRGGASPEGPYYNNECLAIGRAARILEYIQNRLVHKRPADEVKISTTPEDYAYLLWLLERDADPAAITLREIIDRRGIYNHEAIKADMQKVDDGRYWARLLKEYFPEVRAGRVLLFFSPYRPKAELAANPLPECVETVITATDPQLVLHSCEHWLPRRHALSVSTNILYDAFYMPNFGWAPMPNVNLEFYPKRGNFTFRFQFTFPYYHRWSKHKFFQIRDYHFEARGYFNPGQYHTGWYMGAYANTNIYGIGLSATKGWEGEGWGAGLKAGYVVRLGHSKRWRIDLHLAAGAYVTRYDPYVYGNPLTGEQDGEYYYDWKGGSEAFHRRNRRFTWLGPTEAGVTISYDLLFWRRASSGVSFLSQERIR